MQFPHSYINNFLDSITKSYGMHVPQSNINNATPHRLGGCAKNVSRTCQEHAESGCQRFNSIDFIELLLLYVVTTNMQ